MFDVEHVRSIVGDALPAGDRASLRFFAEGWDYELWETDSDLLVRIPRREECVAPLTVEARLLSELAGALPAPVPLPELAGDGFFAYRKLPGVPLESAGLGDSAKREVARHLGQFVSALHGFPLEAAGALGVPVQDGPAWREDHRRFRDEVAEKVLPLLDRDEAGAVEGFWRGYLADDRYFQFEPVLLHADLDGAHVLVDPASGSLASVIDWGDASGGDPAYDFSGFDAPLREEMLSTYALPVDGLLRERAAIYRYKMSPFHAVIYGLTIGDTAWLEKGLAAVREAFA